MIGWNRVKQTTIHMDFGEAALSTAAEMMAEFNDTPQLVICPQSSGLYAEQFCKQADIPLVLLPDATMRVDYWAVAGERSMIWSSGA